MTTIIRAAGAAEFLSLIPRMLGYVPSRSLVVVPLHASRSVGVLRFDLPEDESDTVDRVAATVIGTVCRIPEAESVAAVVFTDATFADTGGAPHADLLDALGRRADASGLHLADALCVAADGWVSLLDESGPHEGRSLDELQLAIGDELALPPAEGDQASGAVLPELDLACKERVGRALGALKVAAAVLCGPDAAGSGEPGTHAPRAEEGVEADAEDEASRIRDSRRIDPAALAAVCALDDLPALFEDALSWSLDDLAPYDAATLIWCLSRPSLRDVALVQWSGTLTSGDEAFDAQLRWESGEEYPTHLAMRMWGDGERPDLARLESALDLARYAAAAAPRAARPGALAMCAWLSWALGRSTHAERYAVAACEIEPEHGLSEIVRSFVHAGHLPDWAFRRSATRP